MEKRSGGGHFGLMLLLREGLPGWLARQGQLLAEQRHGETTEPAASLGQMPDDTRSVALTFPSSLFADLVHIMSNLISPSVQQAQHES